MLDMGFEPQIRKIVDQIRVSGTLRVLLLKESVSEPSVLNFTGVTSYPRSNLIKTAGV